MAAGSSTAEAIEVSVVMPCLNEIATIETCLRKASQSLSAAGVCGELIVADNGSTDGSQAAAAASGARVICVEQRGYGAALQGGIAAAQGRFIVMGDADDSYDFGAIPAFLAELRKGADLVMGNRFRGGIAPGAMPFSHRYLGNPVLSRIGRLFFKTRVGDFHCGLRGFTKAAYLRMGLVTSGMEFASEMVVKASLLGMKISEVPVALSPDGRSRAPHLRTWRDGWRHLRFLLLYSPRWLFLIPGIVLFLVGLLGSAVLIAGPLRIGSVVLDIHALLVLGSFCILGFQLILFAVLTKTFVVREGLHPPSERLNRLYRYFNLEVGLLVGTAATLAGIALIAGTLAFWGRASFAALDPRVTMRIMIPAVVLTVLGVQTIFGSFLLSILGLQQVLHRNNPAPEAASKQV
jgi:glycosyltransferase involved in cell wall biosynthesis